RARDGARGEPADREGDPREGRAGLPRVGGGEEGPRPGAPQGRAVGRRPPGQALRLPEPGRRVDGDLPRRGRVGRRDGEERPRPPLFKVTRKKKEEYVFEERALKEKLQSLGVESSKIEPAGGKGDPIQGAALERLVEALAKLEELARAVERRGVGLQEFLAAE